MSSYQLAQINIARLVAPEGSPEVQDFFDSLDRINALAEESVGFVWRLKSDAGNATEIQSTIDPLLIINMSVWESSEALFSFVYKSAHTPIMAQRRSWFERPEGAYQALWWVERGEQPSVEEGLAKLWHLDRFGPTPLAFTFKARFTQPDRGPDVIDMKPDPWCDGIIASASRSLPN